MFRCRAATDRPPMKGHRPPDNKRQLKTTCRGLSARPLAAAGGPVSMRIVDAGSGAAENR